MQTNLSTEAKTLARADEAESILRSCVHCGFCNATCPTYQLLGNELDGPRGRIYLIKQVLEGEPVSETTQLHLDRCLSCRNCETTCPSGVKYHTLLDIGRAEVERRVARPAKERLLRDGLRQLIPRASLFATALKAGRALKPLMPEALRQKIPGPQVKAKARPAVRHARRMLLVEGCVQPSLSPNTNAAAARVLDRLGISVTAVAQAGCCGATDYHLGAHETGLNRARRNIDAWWPAITAGAEAIVVPASGCGAYVKEYGDMLKHDQVYAQRARHVSSLARDLSEVLSAEPLETLTRQVGHGPSRIAFHCPCTLQHAQKLGGAVEAVLRRLGFDLSAVADAHLCCGSAGTYSITQPELARRLRDNKLAALEAGGPDAIVTANIGCQTHLNSAGRKQVQHWIELVEEGLDQSA
ncbi:glycolate oxidase subunit GlcF [Paraburkholderia youngii]|uniref:Glycolate oxidase iron-sulfur subunit n=1 Tax=Paraburkholderia youngii TaxID=2782701 RepID=A0A7Y6K0Y6_9BURK|nr:glycolate oxidase subunit GlcF [Paraburkholderia youngii]NUY02410.1 glycolate oxidase subunit GlcF [Paraburkholderia youngii]